MNMNDVLFHESHVYIHLTHCLHTPYILWTRQNRNQILNQSIGPQVAHRSVPCSKASVCSRRFLLTGRCALRSCSCPRKGCLLCIQGLFAQPHACRAASAQKEWLLPNLLKAPAACSPGRGTWGVVEKSHSKHPPKTCKRQMEFCF